MKKNSIFCITLILLIACQSKNDDNNSSWIVTNVSSANDPFIIDFQEKSVYISEVGGNISKKSWEFYNEYFLIEDDQHGRYLKYQLDSISRDSLILRSTKKITF